MEDSLRRLTFHAIGDVEHTWHWDLYSYSEEEWLQLRNEQRAWMARYGRQAWNLWDDMLVTEMEEAFAAFVKIVKQEAASYQKDTGPGAF